MSKDPADADRRRIQATDAYVADTGTERGRGVFARRGFAEGELVEEAPVLLLAEPIEQLPKPVKHVVFNWPPSAAGGRHALVLGFGSLYNHANPANMRWDADPAQLTVRFSAVRSIEAGEELTINYNSLGGGPVWYDDNWFYRMEIPVINDPPAL